MQKKFLDLTGLTLYDSEIKNWVGEQASAEGGIVDGYYYNGNFYKEAAHTTLITGETNKLYVDLATNKTYHYNGSTYDRVAQPSYTATEVSAVATTANQGLTSTEQENARANIGAGTSNFDGAYSSLSGTPTLGTASAKDVPTSGNASTTQVVMGNDSRLTDSRNAADVYSWAKASTKPDYDADEVDYDNTDSGLTATNVQDAIDELASSGGGGTATDITYDNTDSGMTATNVQDAVDELSAGKANGEGLTFTRENGNLYLSYPTRIVPFSTGTDAEIKDMLNAYYNDEITWAEMGWQVGDTRVIHLDSVQAPNPNSSNTWAAQDITIVIVDHDHTDLATPINGHTKACITVQTRELLSGELAGSAGTIYVNGDSSKDTTFTKWSNLYMRTYLNDKVWRAFPSTFRTAIKPSTHYRHTYNGTAESEQVTDNLFLPSYPEIFGTASYSWYEPTSPVEGTQFEYYIESTNRVKYPNNNGSAGSSAATWWQGSASLRTTSGSYYWSTVISSGTASYGSQGNNARGLAPAWVM